ncbi:MAG: hypothetical protein K0B01_02435 [Syntrophobacterales bacterium]|nr:hypothetical protein [Syntrophobacterales bacterium]
MTAKNKGTLSPIQYGKFLQAIRQRIQNSRMMAYRAVHKELIDLYWDIGREITQRQERTGWGKAVVERLAKDLQKEFAGSTGFSAQNLWFMRQLYTEYKDFPNLLQLVREIPWGQNIAVMPKLKDPDAREYYLRMWNEY